MGEVIETLVSRVRQVPALDESKKREVCAIISVGGSRRTAAKYVGCAVETIRRTALRDTAFGERLKRAESDLEVEHLQNIRNAGKKNWRASAWCLERLYPHRFGVRPAPALTEEQISEMLAQFAEIVKAEVGDRAVRRRIQMRIKQFCHGLEPAEE